jgi:5-methylcytosine-specific restriction endonuclease McrA
METSMMTDKQFIEICENSISMAQAAVKTGLHFNTFKRRAVKLGCYKINQGGVGIDKKVSPRIDLKEILAGKHPEFQTFKLKNRLLKEGIIKNVCSVCGITEWNGKKLVMELDHIDGNRTNHKLNNLRMLCPNCHAQTETYRAKNIK